MNNLIVFSGNSNAKLAEDICRQLEINLGNAEVSKFSDGEISVKILDNVRGKDVFVVQSTCPPVNDNLIEILIIIDALKRASAKRITAVLPYFGYARQDRKPEPRVPITAKLVANLFTKAGADRILVVDLHAGQIQGFFDIPVDHLKAEPVFVDYFLNKKESFIVVAPDVGGVERARNFAKKLNANLAIIDKRRPKPNVSAIMHIIGKVEEEQNAIIFDDMIDTAGTLCNVATALKEKGVKKIFAVSSHGVLSGNAIENIKNAPIDELVITDTIPLIDGKKLDKIKVLSMDKMLAEAIKRIYFNESISVLFK
ncbi:MAG: ribose-phosphate pyrophosphokinase [Elusimicrobiota bacterium]|jgi:ribose-phosphate pyrophosphokinase|nr:ribose-phosphate pyrophosphokinase [Elusimicrobiota bacterium]